MTLIAVILIIGILCFPFAIEILYPPRHKNSLFRYLQGSHLAAYLLSQPPFCEKKFIISFSQGFTLAKYTVGQILKELNFVEKHVREITLDEDELSSLQTKLLRLSS